MVPFFLINVSDKKCIPTKISFKNRIVKTRASSVIDLNK